MNLDTEFLSQVKAGHIHLVVGKWDESGYRTVDAVNKLNGVTIGSWLGRAHSGNGQLTNVREHNLERKMAPEFWAVRDSWARLKYDQLCKLEVLDKLSKELMRSMVVESKEECSAIALLVSGVCSTMQACVGLCFVHSADVNYADEEGKKH